MVAKPTPMLRSMTLAPSWLKVLDLLRPVFARSGTFTVFVLLATGLVARTRRRTVVGMLAGAGMATVVSFHWGVPVLLRPPLGGRSAGLGGGAAGRGQAAADGCADHARGR